MMSAINKGVPVSEINPDSNVALSYKNLALMVSDSVYRQKLMKSLEGFNMLQSSKLSSRFKKVKMNYSLMNRKGLC